MISWRSGDGGRQFLDRFDRPHVGEQSQFLAQREQRLLGTLVGLGVVPLGAADRAKQNRVAVFRLLEHVVGQRRAELIDRMAAGDAFLELEIERGVTRHDFEHLQRFADDFGTNPVTFENQNLVGHLCLRSPSSGSGATDRLRADSLQASRGRGQIRQIRQFGSSCGGRNLSRFNTFRRGSFTHVLPDAIST